MAAVSFQRYEKKRDEKKQGREERYNAKRPRVATETAVSVAVTRALFFSVMTKMRDWAQPGHRPRWLGYFPVFWLVARKVIERKSPLRLRAVVISSV